MVSKIKQILEMIEEHAKFSMMADYEAIKKPSELDMEAYRKFTEDKDNKLDEIRHFLEFEFCLADKADDIIEEW